MRILSVDDQEENRYLLESLLKGHGHEVVSACNGEEALDILRAQKIDVVVSDILMPKMDGFQLCRTVRAEASLKNIPLLFYTATYTEPRDIAFGLSAGADRYLIKPQDFDTLPQAIIEVYRERNRVGGASDPHPLGEEMEFFRQHNDILFRKLEKKMIDLENANLALAESEARFRNLFEQSPVAYQSLDEDGRYTYINDQLMQLLGYSAAELLGRSFGDFWSTETKHTFPERFAQLKRKGNVRADLRLVRKTGEPLDVHIEGRVQRDISGQFLRTHCILFDMTENMRAAEALRESERRFRETLEVANLIAVQLDQDAKITFANNFLARITGWDVHEVVGRNWLDLFIPHEKRGEIETVHRANLQQTAIKNQYENEILTRAGVRRLVSWTNSPMYGPTGDIIGVTSLGIDITEHRDLEEKLRHAQKLEGIGQLAGGVAHDFNNILSAISGYASLSLRKIGPDDPVRHYIDQILVSVNNATVLTQSLLAFSRKQPVRLAHMNLNDVLGNFEKFLMRLIQEDIELRTVLTDTPLPVLIDRGQIEQVLMNLVTNARDAIHHGGHITIETRYENVDRSFVDAYGLERAAGEYAMITVTDTGSGMPEEIQQKIFEPFFTTKDEGKGTGLGLAMVYGIVKKHEGHITVYSEMGVGTTFRIYLPLSRTAPSTDKHEDKHDIPLRGGTETILLAEDNNAIRKVTAELLREYGYTVLEAVDGSDAVEKFSEHRDRIDLALLDGIMPKMNGKDALREIRILRPKTKAIFMSGYAEDVFTQADIAESESSFIQKPAAPSVILQTVRKMLDD